MYTENEILKISKLQYRDLSINKPVKINNNNNNNNAVTIGYVSEINDKESGEQSYVITDIQLPSHPTPEDLVKNMTIE